MAEQERAMAELLTNTTMQLQAMMDVETLEETNQITLDEIETAKFNLSMLERILANGEKELARRKQEEKPKKKKKQAISRLQ